MSHNDERHYSPLTNAFAAAEQHGDKEEQRLEEPA